MESKYPSFMTYTNSTQSIRLDPGSQESFAGKTYYFTVVIKEKNSDFVKKDYQCTVRVTGDVDNGQLFDGSRVRGTLVSYSILTVDA